MTSHDNVTDIVERLRAWEPLVSDGYECPAAGQSMHEAAAIIEAQQDDLATLRKQLENARSEALAEAEVAVVGTNADGDRSALSAYHKCIAAIRALKGQQ